MQHDFIAIATGGSVARNDKCPVCAERMLYRVDTAAAGAPIVGMFCGNSLCSAWLMEHEAREVPDGR